MIRNHTWERWFSSSARFDKHLMWKKGEKAEKGRNPGCYWKQISLISFNRIFLYFTCVQPTYISTVHPCVLFERLSHHFHFTLRFLASLSLYAREEKEIGGRESEWFPTSLHCIFGLFVHSHFCLIKTQWRFLSVKTRYLFNICSFGRFVCMRVWVCWAVVYYMSIHMPYTTSVHLKWDFVSQAFISRSMVFKQANPKQSFIVECTLF